ncbi:MAG: HD domain-containing protein [Acidobacteria bacterium]|nr:HD domain-containing protein [Acidobacteriota bacterium]
MNPIDIINGYYTPGSKAHEIVVRHGEDVARKAVTVAEKVGHLNPDLEFIREAAMLHDVAIFLTDTPKLDCHGKHPYVCHGYLGRELLENRNLPKHALVCERHVGVGITAEDVRRHNLPLPERDMIPLSIEERIICYADKFFSKNGRKTETEKSVEEVLRNIARYGHDKVATFQSWLELFRD